MPKLTGLHLRTFILPCFILIGFTTAHSQTLRRPVSSAYTALGAYSLHHADVFSFTSNQASLAQLKSFSAGIYGERRFLLAELNNYIAALALETSSGNFGLKTNYYGFSDYNETQIGFAYARQLGKRVDLGVQFNYNGVSIAGYGNDAAIGFEIGSIFHLSEKLHGGIQVTNPVGGKFGKNQEEKLPAVYAFGLGYEASKKFFVSAEIVKEENQALDVEAGLQYIIVPQLLARAGVSTATSSEWVGVGLQLKSFRVDVTASYHQQLGFTPGLMLIFNINRDKD
jgi:hypothetical protein